MNATITPAFRDDRGYTYDARGFPIRKPGELGPPGIRVTICRPRMPFVETLASCLRCRKLVLCFTYADGASDFWGMSRFDQLRMRAWLRVSGCSTDQEFAPTCDECGIRPHGEELR